MTIQPARMAWAARQSLEGFGMCQRRDGFLFVVLCFRGPQHVPHRPSKELGWRRFPLQTRRR